SGRCVPRPSAGSAAQGRGDAVLRRVAGGGHRGRRVHVEENVRKLIAAAGVLLVAPLVAADLKVDLSKEQVGRPPAAFEPMVGTWVIAQDGADKVVMVDGRPW